MKTKEEILKEFDNMFAWEQVFGKNSESQKALKELISTIIDRTREETIREVEQVLDRQELIHKELENQWTGIKISPCGSELYSERPNPHREKREEIIKIKQILNKLKQ